MGLKLNFDSNIDLLIDFNFSYFVDLARYQ